MARITYSNVMATVAVFIALGGISYAAIQLPANSVGRKQLRAKAVTLKKINPKARRALKGRRGASGKPGPQGASGAAGASGASGASGAALLTGVATGIPSFTSGSTFRRVPVTGLGDASIVNMLPQIASLSPARTLVARDLSVRIGNDIPGNASTTVALLVNSALIELSPPLPTVLGCSVAGSAGPSDLTCTAPGPITVPGGSFMWLRITNAAGATTSDPQTAYWGITFEPGAG